MDRAAPTAAGKPGKVGSDLTIEEGYTGARDTALAILGDASALSTRSERRLFYSSKPQNMTSKRN